MRRIAGPLLLVLAAAGIAALAAGGPAAVAPARPTPPPAASEPANPGTPPAILPPAHPSADAGEPAAGPAANARPPLEDPLFQTLPETIGNGPRIEVQVVDETGAAVHDFTVRGKTFQQPGRGCFKPTWRLGELEARGPGWFTWRLDETVVEKAPDDVLRRPFELSSEEFLPAAPKLSDEQLAALRAGRSLPDVRLVLRRAAIVTGRLRRPDGGNPRRTTVSLGEFDCISDAPTFLELDVPELPEVPPGGR